MEPVTIGLTLFFATATGAVIWWLVQVEVGMRRLRDDLETAHSETCESLKVLTARTENLADSALALQRTHPGLSGVIDAHRTLDRLQATLSGEGGAEEDDDGARRDVAAGSDALDEHEGDECEDIVDKLSRARALVE